jgi:hypothetical protein
MIVCKHPQSAWFEERTMWDKLTWQADPLAFAVGLASILITSYIALLLHRLSRKFGQSETIRSSTKDGTAFIMQC